MFSYIDHFVIGVAYKPPLLHHMAARRSNLKYERGKKLVYGLSDVVRAYVNDVIPAIPPLEGGIVTQTRLRHYRTHRARPFITL